VFHPAVIPLPRVDIPVITSVGTLRPRLVAEQVITTIGCRVAAVGYHRMTIPTSRFVIRIDDDAPGFTGASSS
jgi:hypothetical protein